jgi:hypothetical protein
MSVTSGQVAPVSGGVPETLVRETPGVHRLTLPSRPRRIRLATATGILLSPAFVAVVLRLRLMAPADLPDPAMHTAYIVDPQDVFARYAAVYAASARLREGARVGFLVPARLSYLAFGAVPGFLVLRYVLALIAVAPVYLLLRRLYGRPAGVAGLLVVLSSPVLVTAWGTDYPDSAVVSYALGAIACLAMPCRSGRRRGWLAAAAALLTLAVWSHGVAVPLTAATLAAYLGVRLARDRAGLAGDIGVLAGVAAAVTGLLVVAAAALLGRGDFIATTWDAYRYLSEPWMVAATHSASWRWAPYRSFLLVPPAGLLAFGVAVARRGPVRTPVLLAGAIAASQLVVYAWLQFFGSVETLEQHYFSSTLWPGVVLVLAITIGELARPLADRPLARWLPAAVLLAVPLAYEAWPHVPPFGWAPAGLLLALAVVAAALAARAGASRGWRPGRPAVFGLALVALTAAALVLTVAPEPAHHYLPGTVPTAEDPPPAYATALGGSAALAMDSYRVATELPGFVGPAAYPGEQVVMWWPVSQGGFGYREFTGMYHGMFNSLKSDIGDLTAADRTMLAQRRPAELLLLTCTGARLGAAAQALRSYWPQELRTGTLRSGPVELHVRLLRLWRYYRASRRARPGAGPRSRPAPR